MNTESLALRNHVCWNDKSVLQMVCEFYVLWSGLMLIIPFKARIGGRGSDNNIALSHIAFMTKYVAVSVTPFCSACLNGFRFHSDCEPLLDGLSVCLSTIPVILVLLRVKKERQVAGRKKSFTLLLFHWNNQHYCQNTECDPYLYQVFNITYISRVWLRRFLGLVPLKNLVWSLYMFLMLKAFLLKLDDKPTVLLPLVSFRICFLLLTLSTGLMGFK